MAYIKKKGKERWYAPKEKPAVQEGRKYIETRYNSPRWKRLCIVVRARDNNLCQECKRNGKLTEIGLKPRDHACDHVQNVREGGLFWDINNIETLCSSCHNKKSGRETHKGKG